MHAEDRSLMLLPMGWETDSAPSTSGKAQEVINSELLEGCDVLVAIFWTRLGTPTDSDPSGTAEEIRRHVGRGRDALLYFSDAKAPPSRLDPDQYKAVTAFKNEQMGKALVEPYESLEDFRSMFPRHLERIVKRQKERLKTEMPSEYSGYFPDASTSIELSKEASALLTNAAVGDGTIMRSRTTSGTYAQAGELNEPQTQTPRNQAKWMAAIDELEGAGYIRDSGYKGEVYDVTDAGFEISDRLRSSKK